MAKVKTKEEAAPKVWHNPAVREENAHTNFTKRRCVIMATVQGTVLDVDASEQFMRAKYSKNSRVTLWELNQTTGHRTALKNSSVHF